MRRLDKGSINALNTAVGAFFAAVAGSLLFHCTDV